MQQLFGLNMRLNLSKFLWNVAQLGRDYKAERVKSTEKIRLGQKYETQTQLKSMIRGFTSFHGTSRARPNSKSLEMPRILSIPRKQATSNLFKREMI